jgi:hypothetical protein
MLIYQSMILRDFSIICSLLLFLSSVVCSFTCTSHLYSLLNILLGILYIDFVSWNFAEAVKKDRDSLTSFLLICVYFISSSYRIALGGIFKTMLNRSGDSGHPCLIPDFRGNAFRFSPLDDEVGYRFVLHSLYYVEVHSFHS